MYRSNPLMDDGAEMTLSTFECAQSILMTKTIKKLRNIIVKLKNVGHCPIWLVALRCWQNIMVLML